MVGAGAVRPIGRRCWTVKTNVRHLESARSFMAKVVLALQHDKLPPSIFAGPSPYIGFDAMRLK